jgi:hypothetical protein
MLAEAKRIRCLMRERFPLWGRLITCAPIANRRNRATPGPDRAAVTNLPHT